MHVYIAGGYSTYQLCGWVDISHIISRFDWLRSVGGQMSDDIVNTFFLKQIDCMLPCICSVVYQTSKCGKNITDLAITLFATLVFGLQ